MLAIEDTITDNGVTYQVGGITLEVMAAMEDWVERDALAELQRLFPNDGVELRVAMGRLIAAGTFKFYSTTMQSRIYEVDGSKKLWTLRIRQNHPSVDEKTIGDVIENKFVELIKIRDHEQAEALDPKNSPAPGEGAIQTSIGTTSLPASPNDDLDGPSPTSAN